MRPGLSAAVRALFAALAFASAAHSAAQPKSDWELAEEERNWREGEFTLPPYPKAADLLEFQTGVPTDFRFFIDGSSLSVGGDGVVRYTLVARSASGVENVSYEGLRCKTGAVRAYAFGRDGGGWTAGGTPWRQIDPKSAQRWHFALWREYFCPYAMAIRDAAEGRDALRRGAHPDAPRAASLGR